MLSATLVAGFIGCAVNLTGIGLASAQSPAPIKLAVLGDSLTAGYGLPADAAFPARLEKALRDRGIEVGVLNAGVSGDTSSAGRDRVEWSIPEGTEAVIVELGANDALRGLDPAITKAALEDIIKQLQARKISVMLAGMYAPRNYGPDYAAKFDPIFSDLAKAYNVPLYPFFLDGVAGDAKLNLPDGLHPTAEGIDRIVAKILPDVEAFLQNVSAQRR